MGDSTWCYLSIFIREVSMVRVAGHLLGGWLRLDDDIPLAVYKFFYTNFTIFDNLCRIDSRGELDSALSSSDFCFRYLPNGLFVDGDLVDGIADVPFVDSFVIDSGVPVLEIALSILSGVIEEGVSIFSTIRSIADECYKCILSGNDTFFRGVRFSSDGTVFRIFVEE